MKGKDLSFDEINVDFLQAYEAYLRARGIKKDTIHNHLKTLRAVYYRAIKERIVSQGKNPFFVFRLELEKFKKKERLNTEEIKKLQELELERGTRLFDSRNLFLFSFYNAGIRIGDLLQLKWSDISKDGRLEYIMSKTGKVKSIKLLPQALQILRYYKGKGMNPEDFIFPFLKSHINRSNKAFFFSQLNAKATLINKCLKELAQLAGIEKRISNHIARHSFADIARQKNSNLYDLQNLLGHSDIGTTKKYFANFDLDSQDKTHEAVFEKF